MSQILNGKVISNKMRNTVTVEVSRFKEHPIYRKFIKISKKYKAHSEEQISVGSSVEIESVKPLSKDKKWKVIKLVK
ncbi:MAG TPA: 30S ribosomal protein S17 [Candidatus Paceibacterota bacterium]